MLKPKKYARLSNEVNTKKQPSIQCKACGTINISKNVNNFLSTNPTSLILCSLVSKFWNPNLEKKILFFFFGWS